MTTFSRTATVFLAAALLMPLAGCAVAPEQRVNVLCPDLLTRAQLDSLFGVNAVGLKYIELEAALSYPAIPETYVVRQLGGMACEWSNGAGGSETTGASIDYQGIRITYLPDARAEWDHYAGLYSFVGTRDLNCFSYSDVMCTLNSRVGTGWLEIDAYGMLPGTEAAALARSTPPVDAIEAARLAGTISPAVWAPPAGTLAMPSDCAALVSNSTVVAALGLPGALVAESGPHGGWSIEAAQRGWRTSPAAPGCSATATREWGRCRGSPVASGR